VPLLLLVMVMVVMIMMKSMTVATHFFCRSDDDFRHGISYQLHLMNVQ
jgi:hypothetical protein